MAKPWSFQLPNSSQRSIVLGRTGSGKTVMGSWLLSKQGFDKMPWTVIDYKGDELFDGLQYIREIGPTENIPKHPGLYRMRPHPVHDVDAVEAWMTRSWEREHNGLFVDEMFMLPDKGGFEGILTQGRSKHIPVIALSQRPAFITRYAYTEADHFFVFHLNMDDDKIKVRRMINGNAIGNLPDYHSWYYSVKATKLTVMLPTPTTADIQTVIDERLKPKRKFL